MKLSIRLQNHGCANHPYWWIVVAPQMSNLKGRFIEHVGYWMPRQKSNAHRAITLNLPRIKYWMGCGAVPTPRIQNFLHLWSLMPKSFYPIRSEEEMAARRKPESEWTEKDKIKQERKRKRRQRLKLNHINYHKPMAKYKSLQTYHFVRHETKLREKIHASERENQILRELLLHNEYVKINRINQLSGNAVMDDTQELLKLEAELAQAKAELALLDKNIKSSSPLQKIKVIKEINTLVDRIREVEKQREPFRIRKKSMTQGENVTKEQIDSQIQYELISKKIDKMNEDLAHLEKLYEVVTLQEYANHIHSKEKELSAEEALELAQEEFIMRGQRGLPPLIKFDIFYQHELDLDPDEILDYDEEVQFERKQDSNQGEKKQTNQEDQDKEEKNEENEDEENVNKKRKRAKQGEENETGDKENKRKDYNKELPQDEQPDLVKDIGKEIGVDLKLENEFIDRVHEQNLVKFMLTRPDVIVPTNRPVHPFPDLETYIPEEYYEPITDMNLKVVHFDSLEPNDQLLKYHNKREYSSNKSSKGFKKGKGQSKRSKQTV